MVEQETAPPELNIPSEHKKTLSEILTLLKEFDDTGGDPEKQKALIDELRGKVDRIKMFIDSCTDIFKRQKAWSKEFSDSARVIENQIKSLKSHFLEVMKFTETEVCPGEKWVLKRENAAPKTVTAEPTAELMMQYPDLIEDSYKWRSVELVKKAIENKLIPPEIAHIESNEKLMFRVSKPQKGKSK